MQKFAVPIIVLLVLAFAAGLYVKRDVLIPATSKNEQAAEARITFRVGGTTHETEVRAGASFLDAMAILAASGDITYATKEYAGLGALVESINGTSNSGDSYWFLYVNGTSSMTGVSQTFLQDGDQVEWRYTKSQ